MTDIRWLEGDDLLRAARDLTAAANLPEPCAAEPLAGGGNNRTYRLRARGRDLLLKAYFRDPADPRDRLKTEFAFSRFAWDRGVNAIPEPIAQNPALGLGLYAFIHGRNLRPEEIDATRVYECLDFLLGLNRFRNDPAARDLPAGSEAYFSLTEHLAGVGHRVERLEQIASRPDDLRTPTLPRLPIDEQACQFIRSELRPVWDKIVAHVESFIPRMGGDRPLPLDQRCLSPSDFGLHNALLAPDGRLIFHDFEYAGWDDAGKTAGDFFCQPRLPAPSDLYDDFLERLVKGLGLPESHLDRARLLRSVYRVKWCCIMLNEFLPLGARRRGFALSPEETQARKIAQIRKARAHLATAIHPDWT